jgi:catechol 2,3-dioxygenase
MKVQELGHIVLAVRDLERSTEFYRDILGLGVVAMLKGRQTAFSGGGTHHELLLLQASDEIVEPPKQAMKHVAFKIGVDDDALREALAVFKANDIYIDRIQQTIHTHSIFVRDPDGNEVEVFIDPQPEVWRNDPATALNTRPWPLEL